MRRLREKLAFAVARADRVRPDREGLALMRQTSPGERAAAREGAGLSGDNPQRLFLTRSELAVLREDVDGGPDPLPAAASIPRQF